MTFRLSRNHYRISDTHTYRFQLTLDYIFTEFNTWHKSLVIININDGYEIKTVIINKSNLNFRFHFNFLSTSPKQNHTHVQ